MKAIACLEYGLITHIQQDPEEEPRPVVSISSSPEVRILVLLYCKTLCFYAVLQADLVLYSSLSAIISGGKSTVPDGLILPTIRYLCPLYENIALQIPASCCGCLAFMSHTAE